MKIKNVDWNKNLIVFFGDEVGLQIQKISEFSKIELRVFPEHLANHPWDHIEFIETVTSMITLKQMERWVIITNSSYIIDHLANLMKGARIDADEKYTRCKSKNAFIKKKNVAVYVCTKGKIKNALPKKDDEEIINWDNLSYPSEWLTGVYFEMGD